MSEDKFQLIHPEGKPAPRLDRAKYDLVRAALLQVIPQSADGIAWNVLADRVAQALTPEQVSTHGSVSWLTTWVRLDMEARGEIERVPGSKPQRVRRR